MSLFVLLDIGVNTQKGSAPTGTRGVVDNAALHTDGPGAVPPFNIITWSAGLYWAWCGLEAKRSKSIVSAVDHAIGRMVLQTVCT
jgi:hypothetical protein